VAKLTAPVVGVLAGVSNASWGQWHRRAVLLPAEYVERLSAAGALPVLLPPVERYAPSGTGDSPLAAIES